MGKCRTVAIRPTLLNRYVIKIINNVLVILVPYKNWKTDILDNILGNLFQRIYLLYLRYIT